VFSGDKILPYLDTGMELALRDMSVLDHSQLLQNAAYCFGSLCGAAGEHAVKYYERGLAALEKIVRLQENNKSGKRDWFLYFNMFWKSMCRRWFIRPR